MNVILGIFFALCALIFWGFGDFLIQRSTRKFGDVETLFVITFIGTIILTPFIFIDLINLSIFNFRFWILVFLAVLTLFAALLDFEALKKGKLAVIEPLLILEVPVSIILAFIIISERIGLPQLLLIGTLLTGIVLVSLKPKHLKKKIWFEKGMIFGIFAAILLGAVNFLVGYSSRLSSPLMTNWFINIFISLICFIWILCNNRFSKLIGDFRRNRKFMLIVSLFDNAAWISYALATTFAPIAIAIAFSESYILLAVFLGLLINKEKIFYHQKLGLIISIISGIILAIISI